MKARFIALAALVLGMVSCQQDVDTIAPVGGEVDFQLAVAAPELVGTRAGEDGKADDNAAMDSAFGAIDYLQGAATGDYRQDWENDADLRYTLEVYDKADSYADAEPVKDRQVVIVDKYQPVVFDLRLVPGRDYHFVVFADFVAEGSAEKTPSEQLLVNGLRHEIGKTLADITVFNEAINDEVADSYFATKDITISNSAAQDIVLKRPYGKVRVIATDLAELNLNVHPKSVVVEYESFNPNKFNAVTGDIAGAYTVKEFTTTFVDNVRNNMGNHYYNAGYDAKKAENLKGEKRNSHITLFTDYILGENALADGTYPQTPIHFTMTVNDGKDEIKTTAFTTDIPVERNKLTTVIGNVLTTATEIEVRIDDNFAGELVETLWDGKSATAPAYDDATKTYTIYEESELAWLADQVNGTTRAAGRTFKGETFKLTKDLDLNNEEWTPIGNSTNKFQGTFDGQGHKITNLLITGNNSYVGLFGFTTDGEIKNLVVENAKVSGRLGVGVVAGSPYTSKFSDITVQGHVEVNGMAYVGGVGGRNAYANWNNVTVNVDETSYVNANSVEDGVAYRTYVGGVCGFNGEGGHSFKNITSNIDVKGSTIDVGGLFGIAHYGNKFENCSCSGDVEIYAAEEAEEAQEIGGIAGVWNNGGADVVFTNCTFTGTLKTNIADVDFYYGGLIGKPYSATGTGKLIIDGYEMVANGVGMKDGEYFVMSAQGLAWVEAQEDKYFAGKTIKLANDIDMTGVTIEKPIHFWNGRTTFDGQDYTISNLTMSTTSTEKKPFGLFGGTADIKNVKFDKANISGYSYVAVVAGNLYGNIENCHVSNSYVTCTYWMAGAMSGQYNAGNVTNCSVTNTTITGPAAVGALVGIINETAGERKVENCTVTDCTVAQNGSFGGVYDKMFGTAVGAVNIDNSKVYINGCKVENTTVKGATSANIFGHNWGDNTTIYVDGYTYGSDGTIKDEVTGNLIANSPESLEAALETAGAAGAGDTTIVIAENAILDMNNTEWTPIYVNGYNGADIVTVEGNGATLKGLTAPLFKGGFAGGSGIIIRDLTITESNIVSTSTQGSGAFIECADSMETITLENCHFTKSTISGSRTGGLIGWTSGYSNENDGPVKTYVTIKNCSVIDVDINATGSAAAINGHAGASDWTYTTIENCTVKNCNINSTDSGSWRTGVVVGTANVGEVTISNITESGNTLTQTGKTAPEGYLRNYYGRAVLGTTGKLTIEGNEYVAEGLLKNENGDQIAYSEAGLKEALKNGGTVVLANPFTIDQSDSNGYGKTGINMTNGGTLDGNGNELGAPGSTGTWDSAINTSGGTIKNIKVTEGFRGIFIKKDDNHNEKLYLDNVTIEGTTYTISCDQGANQGLEATNSTFKGWTSYAGTLGNAKFTDCYFGKGNGYSFCRPYAPTEFVGCEFEAGFRLDPRAAVTFENCTLDGVALTAENIATLVTNTAKVTIK